MPRKSARSRVPVLGTKRMTKEQYEQVLPPLRDTLLAAQKRMQEEKALGLVVIITGTPTAGRSETVNDFLEWLDPKHIRVHALEKLRKASRSLPALWRYWNTLPARGEIAFYFMGWYEDYTHPALAQPAKAKRHAARTLERIRQVEAMLLRDGVRTLKMHLTVSKDVQKKRIHELRSSKLTRWRITREERWLARHHDRVNQVAQQCFAATSQPGLEWHVIDGEDEQSRSFAAGQLLLEAMATPLPAVPRKRAAAKKHSRSGALPSAPPGGKVNDDTYDVELERLRGRFALLTRRGRFAKHGAVFAFEGMDAAGKGGAIRRLTSALDARQYNVVPISAPSPEELSYPYLWRFWRHVPRKGGIAVFDRSWYGRVLVERVRGFTAPTDWQRAYDEINEFERQLAEHGLVVHKFWLNVSKAEQLERFQARDEDVLKRYKVDPEDWVNRKLFDQYQAAAREMIERTSTEIAPWTIVEGDDKKYARLKVLGAACEALEKAMG